MLAAIALSALVLILWTMFLAPKRQPEPDAGKPPANGANGGTASTTPATPGATPGASAPGAGPAPKGLKVTKVFTRPTERDRYDMTLEVAVERDASESGPEKLPVRVLGVGGLAPEARSYSTMDAPAQPVRWVFGPDSEPARE